jgi:hypothetical protein
MTGKAVADGTGRRFTIGGIMLLVVVAAMAMLVVRELLEPRTRQVWVRAGVNLGALCAGFLIPAAVVLLTRREAVTGASPKRIAAVLILGALSWVVALFATYRLIILDLGF